MSNETWQQAVQRQQKINKAKMGAREAPVVGFVYGVNPNTEKATVSHYGGLTDLGVKHPFCSQNSWFRSMPQIGQGVVVYYQADTREFAILDYYNRSTMEERIKAYQEGQDVFRPLQPGEHEINSIGFAQSFYGRRPSLESRGGIVRTWCNQDELECGAKSPLHRTVLMHNKANTIGNETRFGVVKRYTSYMKKFYPKYNGKYAFEYYTNLKNIDGNDLFTKHEGHVLDEEGAVISSEETGRDLRALHRYFTTSSEELSVEIDDEGNTVLSLPSSSKEGIIIKVPNGNVRLDVGLNCNINVNGDKSEVVGKSWLAKAVKFIFTSSRNKYTGDLVTNNAINNDPITGKPLIGVGGMEAK